MAPSDVPAIDAQASALMKRGLRLMEDARPDGVVEALACFDQALALRRRLPVATVPALAYGLAACWVNRADALVRLDDARAALAAYDEAVALLRDLPLADDPRFPRRLAIAHQNRGLALQAVSPAAAAEAFADAIAVLEDGASARVADRSYLLAVVWMNLANARVAEAKDESAESARDAARRAIALVADLEDADVAAAEAGLTARHLLCQTIAGRLSPPTAADEPVPDEVHEATDAVDDGLALARRWEGRGVARFRGLAHDLFRFGARVYARYQPQFLDEFILENTDPVRSSPAYVESAEMRSAAVEAYGLARRASR